MKKLIAVIVISLSFFCKLKAQNTDLYKVYLKSGLILKAELVKIVPDSFIQVKQYGMLTTLKFDMIDSVVFSESRLSDLKFAAQAFKPIKSQLMDSVWSFGIQPGFTIGIGGWDLTSSFVLRGSVLKNNGKHLMYGFNFGLDPYAYYEQVIGAANLEGRYYFRAKSSHSMFFNALGGYGFNLTSPALGKEGGPNVSAGFGHSFRTNSGTVFSVILGYKYQQFKEYINVWQVGRVLTYNNLNRMELKFEWRY